MLNWIRNLLVARAGRMPSPPAEPNCRVYVRQDCVVVIAEKQSVDGWSVASEPVQRLPAATTDEQLGDAILTSLGSPVSAAGVVADDAGILRQAGFASWTALERAARYVAVQRRGPSLLIQPMAATVDGGYEVAGDVELADSVDNTGLGRAVRGAAGRATPRPPAAVRRPAGFVKPPADTGTCDVPEPFGYKTWWLACASTDPRAVADAIGLRDLQTRRWREGAAEASERFMTHAFVCPSVEGWTFVLFPELPADEPSLRALLERLSDRFGEAQAYSNVRTSSAYMWARAERGRVARAFSYADGQLLIDLGPRTSDEVEFGVGVVDDERSPDEQDVLRVAGRWSINPMDLGDQPTTGSGWIGRKDRR